ncbi:DNA helicase RecQ [Amphibacillus sp. MSJ-3]|uniref:DNA helicase RecQ n=1 Tax=Amphibacillus sp. MSJ-3 TaxID=2841505 RepID=UPI001C0F1ABC|nr:DNA helicase RecQ [Amphibacillus sp. MSJ-3]MBU5594824.1 DNA helicase RecQ [Amphibacillus sp. MSJ-3]
MDLANAQKVLQDYYGYDDFRTGQKKLISAVLNGQNALGIMPTGGGKSLCYQIPGILLNGTAIIISPLISLMKDQVDSLHTLGIKATYINSSLTNEEYDERMALLREGYFDFIYVAPERFDNSYFRSIIEQLQISFIAFDEAHCISQWGHDFRPSYRSVIQTLEQINHIPLRLALTATATTEVIQDIQKLLNIDDQSVVNTGFYRENLHFHLVKGQNKQDFLFNYLSDHKQESGIIYAPTRKLVDTIHAQLIEKGYRVAYYHAGLSEDVRRQQQNKFINDEVEIMVATNAFGMGIDKSNVRYVIHHSLPMNIEAYYQEAGRAGRDGEPSDCILLFSGQDSHLPKFFIEQSELDEEKKALEYKKLRAMINYCHTEICLPRYILDYFEEDQKHDDCGHCSNCTRSGEKVDRTRDAQMVLSCVMRMEQRFGTGLTAKVLKGSKDKKVKQFQLDHLSTYGLMKQRTEKEITNFIHFLVAENYLTTGDQKYPILKLTPKAADVLKNNMKVWMHQTEIQQNEAVDFDRKLFEQMRLLRKELADQDGVPPYIIFSDATLKELCRFLPENKTEMLQIKGIGLKKFDSYGQAFLELIQLKTSDQPSHLISYQLYSEGNPIELIAKKRDIQAQTVATHLFKAYQEGGTINWQDFFDDEIEDTVLKAYHTSGEPYLKSIKELVHDEIDYTMIKAVLIKNDLLEEE